MAAAATAAPERARFLANTGGRILSLINAPRVPHRDCTSAIFFNRAIRTLRTFDIRARVHAARARAHTHTTYACTCARARARTYVHRARDVDALNFHRRYDFIEGRGIRPGNPFTRGPIFCRAAAEVRRRLGFARVRVHLRARTQRRGART